VLDGRRRRYAERGGLERRFERLSQPFTISGNTTRDLDMTPMAAVVSGRVKDDRAQNVEFAYVRATNKSRSNWTEPTALANQDGTYSLNLTPGDSYDISFSKDGWDSQTCSVSAVVSGTTSNAGSGSALRERPACAVGWTRDPNLRRLDYYYTLRSPTLIRTTIRPTR